MFHRPGDMLLNIVALTDKECYKPSNFRSQQLDCITGLACHAQFGATHSLVTACNESACDTVTGDTDDKLQQGQRLQRTLGERVLANVFDEVWIVCGSCAFAGPVNSI